MQGSLFTQTIVLQDYSASYRAYVRAKAMQAGSKIVYAEKGVLFEEDPKTNVRQILQTEQTG